MLRKISIIISIVLAFNFISCGLTGSKADKKIVATLQLKEHNPSKELIERTIFKLEQRFDKFGVQPIITETGNPGELSFVLETAGTIEATSNLLKTAGVLGFYRCYKQEEFLDFLEDANELLKDSTAIEQDPLFELVTKVGYPGDSMLFYSQAKDTAIVNTYLQKKEVRQLLGSKKNNAKFLWGLADKNSGNFPLHVIKTNRDGGAVIDGEVIDDARLNYSSNGAPAVSITMNSEGSRQWEGLTNKAYLEDFQIAMVIDNVVLSAPRVAIPGGIVGGRSEITGGFSIEEATQLAMILSAGAVPPIKILEFNVEPIE